MLSSLSAVSVFYLIACLAVVFSLLAVSLRNTFHSALSLIVVLLMVAGLYIYLDAEFLALVQILIYIGAIMTLIIFAIMLTSKISDKSIARANQQKPASLLISGSAGAFLIYVFSKFSSEAQEGTFKAPELADIGRELLSGYALPFEIISVILLAAFIGASAISRKD